MSILVKWSNFNKENGINVTGYKLYKSDVSRADCISKSTEFKTFEGTVTNFEDKDTLEHKLYWYKVEAITEYGNVMSTPRAMLWRNNPGIFTELVRGDYESGMLHCTDYNTLYNLLNYANWQFIKIYRELGLNCGLRNESITRNSDFAAVVNGSIMIPQNNFSQIDGMFGDLPQLGINTSTLSNNNDKFVANFRKLVDIVTASEHNTFYFNDNHYKIDVMTLDEYNKHHEYTSINMHESVGPNTLIFNYGNHGISYHNTYPNTNYVVRALVRVKGPTESDSSVVVQDELFNYYGRRNTPLTVASNHLNISANTSSTYHVPQFIIRQLNS